jgi:hypothetical protein
MEFTADSGGNIAPGPVEITDTHFEREFDIDSGAVLVNTVLSTVLSRVGTGMLSGTTITWDNEEGVNAYQETVVGEGNCTPEGLFCDLGGEWPRDLSGINEVPLPDFTISPSGDAFVSDNGTEGRSDDINRPTPDEGVTVTDTWAGVEVVPEPGREILLLAGALGLVGLRRLRERGCASA